MKREFTAIFEKRGKWYVAYVEEVPGVNTQGRTLKEARANLREALRLIIEATSSRDQRFSSPQDLPGSGYPQAEEINDLAVGYPSTLDP